MAPIGGIGIELWTMQDGILFDNVLLASDPAVAKAVAAKTFDVRKAAEAAEAFAAEPSNAAAAAEAGAAAPEMPAEPYVGPVVRTVSAA
jgi:calnexin